MSLFTKKFIDTLEVTGKDYFIWDKEVPGFGLKVSAAGKKTFVIQFRNSERQTKRLTLGTYPALHPQIAREKALSTWNTIHKGEDPSKSKSSSGGLLFSEVWNEYIESLRIAKKSRHTFNSLEIIERRYLRDSIFDLPLADLTREVLIRKLSALESKPIMYNATMSFVKASLNRALDRGLIDRNPATRIKMSTSRKVVRWLSVDETARFFAALAEERSEYRDFYMFLYHTGARHGEVVSLRWEHISLEERTWFKPAVLTKQGRDSYIPLSDEACLILKRQMNSGDLVFPLPPNRSRCWLRVIKKAAIQNFRIHDLRHNFASMLVSKGVSLEVIGKLLGHSSYQTTQRYAHLSHDALREALDKLTQK